MGSATSFRTAMRLRMGTVRALAVLAHPTRCGGVLPVGVPIHPVAGAALVKAAWRWRSCSSVNSTASTSVRDVFRARTAVTAPVLLGEEH
ncbi:hypothetical protein [Streptomyces virginiae]|uniref:Secreted protein n=1 Tax=Streptomyces virginiae TaxID=1961 RepID=A0ABZ1TND0_STRVG|nr:hypothetical protein [Streptomyces virginiae]